VVAVLLITSLTAIASPARATSAPAAPPEGSLFGGYVNADGTAQTPATVTALQGDLGRPLDLNRVYAGWNTKEPTEQVTWDIANGITPLLSIDPYDTSGTVIQWSAIAAGSVRLHHHHPS
jgi:hypothetical protein